MQTSELPETVRRALGPDAARDLQTWLDERFSHGEAEQVPISALVARQKVNVLMLERVSNLLLAADPVLVQLPDGQMVWRVPVDLTLPGRGRVGRVVEVEVDAQYGDVRCDDATLTEADRAAHDLARSVLPAES